MLYKSILLTNAEKIQTTRGAFGMEEQWKLLKEERLFFRCACRCVCRYARLSLPLPLRFSLPLTLRLFLSLPSLNFLALRCPFRCAFRCHLRCHYHCVFRCQFRCAFCRPRTFVASGSSQVPTIFSGILRTPILYPHVTTTV